MVAMWVVRKRLLGKMGDNISALDFEEFDIKTSKLL